MKKLYEKANPWPLSFRFTRVLSLRVEDVTGTIFTEIPSYKLSELVADIGGSLGLILGIRNGTQN